MPEGGHSEEKIASAPSGGRWREGRGHLLRAGDQRGDVLPLEEDVRGAALSELREMCQLRDGNAQLERLVADLLLDGHGLSEIVRKKL